MYALSPFYKQLIDSIAEKVVEARINKIFEGGFNFLIRI